MYSPAATRARSLYPVIASLATAILGADKPPPAPGDAMFDKYLAAETARLSQRFLDGAKTLDAWQARRPRLRQEYLDMLGLWPLPEKTPLHATVAARLEYQGAVIENLHFESRPGLYVTGNLYRPMKSPGRLPAVLYVCGHSGRGRDGCKTAFQDHGLWFAHNGYVCLIIDTLQLGEVPGIHHGTYSYGRWWWQARGYTPAGVECWNGIRAIDYLAGRPDVDPGRIAVTGISGGGASTIWIAAADERVRCAVPVSGMSDLESYVAHKVINGHCDCMLMINTYGWEWTTIAALIAPRPLLFCNSDQDPLFPMDGNRRIIDRLRRLYKLYDKADLVDDHVSHGGHDYRPDLRVAIFRWINRHLKNDTGPVADASFDPQGGSHLRAFPTDRDLPRDAVNGKIDETFVPQARVKLPAPGAFEQWKRGLLKELRARSFRTLPERIPAAELAGPYKQAPHPIRTTPGIEAAVGLIDGRVPKAGEPWNLVVVESTEDLLRVPAWAKPYTDGRAGYLLAPRGTGPTAFTFRSPPNYVERAHALLGSTVDTGRVYDIAATAAFQAHGHDRVRVIGRGPAGVLAAYAALFEPGIAEVVVVDPPASHRAGPIFLNVLRVLDVPEALSLLAPRPLALVNAKDQAFDRTAQIYKLAGAEGKLQRRSGP